ncbi:MAG TPA: tetratricopeptide repeat protein [Blastocatellia bacterium]|jgi:Flp pilus assembly protein TadD
MNLQEYYKHFAAVMLITLSMAAASFAQAPPSIQFFMPDGSLPTRELRFSLSSNNGRINDTYYTDSKGRFLVTSGTGLSPVNGFTITVQSDGRSFGTTTYHYKTHGASTIYHIQIFLNRVESEATRPAGVINLAEFDALVPETARLEYEAGMALLREGKSDQAIAKLKKAIDLFPNYFRALNDLGVIYMKLKLNNEAGDSFEKAIAIAPRIYYPRLNLGIIRTRQSRYKDAIKILEPLNKENPQLPDVSIALGDALMADNRLNDAERHLRDALEDKKISDSMAGDAHYKLGLLLNRKRRFEEAIQELTVADKLIPNSARIHLQLGGALMQVKRLDEAEALLLTSYQLGGKEMGAAQFLLGQVYFMKEEFEKAMHAFEQYLVDVPQVPNRAEVQGVIEKIKAATKK